METPPHPIGLQVDRSVPDVLILCLDRPDQRNAIDLPLVDGLLSAIRTAGSRAVVLGSVDPRCFCSGADLILADADRAVVSERLYQLYEQMIDLDLPIVAAVSGHAVGAGAQLALASDLRIASPDTQFRFLGTGHGLVVGGWALPSLVGRGRAMEYCATMRTIHADEALEVGLVNQIADDAMSAAVEQARSLTALDAPTVARLKGAVRDATGLRDSLARERRGNADWSGRVGSRREK